MLLFVVVAKPTPVEAVAARGLKICLISKIDFIFKTLSKCSLSFDVTVASNSTKKADIPSVVPDPDF